MTVLGGSTEGTTIKQNYALEYIAQSLWIEKPVAGYKVVPPRTTVSWINSLHSARCGYGVEQKVQATFKCGTI